MKRDEFMRALEAALADAPADERDAALQYYNDYLDDAGEEDEERVIEALGDPATLARSICKDALGETAEQGGIYTGAPVGGNGQFASDDAKAPSGRKPVNVWKWVCIGLIIAILSPFILALAVTVLAIVVAFVVSIFAVIASLAITGVAVMGGGLAAAGIGVLKIFAVPAAGLYLCGIGILMMAIGLLATVFFVWAFVKTACLLGRLVIRLLRKPIEKKEGGEEDA